MSENLYKLQPEELDSLMRSLTEFQIQLVSRVARRMPSEEIAKELSIGAGTISTHLQAVCIKIGARRPSQVVGLFMSWDRYRNKDL